MNLKNYQEDLVLYIVDLVLKDRPEIAYSDVLLHDVAAYTLNRLPPRYIMSERGITRLAAEHWVEEEDNESMVDLVRVVLLANKGVDMVLHRRSENQSPGDTGSEQQDLPDATRYWHNFPFLIGRVVDKTSGEPLLGTSVQLSINGELAELAGNGWSNPYTTNPGTRGLFSFLPKPVQAKAKSRTFDIELCFTHDAYQQTSLERKIRTEGDYAAMGAFISDNILNLETIALEPV